MRMPNLFKQTAVLSLVLLNCTIASAGDKSLFYWDNIEGLKSAEHCQVSIIKNSKLGFATKRKVSATLDLDNAEGKSFATISNGTLIKLNELETNLKKNSIEIVGVNSLTDSKKSSLAVRGDVGFVSKGTLESIEKRVIKINEDTLNIKAGTFLKAQGDKEYLGLSCPEFGATREYLVFNMYSQSGEKSVSKVGVYWDETSIFKNISTFAKSEMHDTIPLMVSDEVSVADEIKSLTKNNIETQIEEIVAFTPEIIEPEISLGKTDSIAVQSSLENIVCTAGSKINVRNEALDQVIYTAKNEEPIKVFQGWGENTKEGIIDGKTYTFVKVEFTEREEKDQRVGFIVSSYVKAKSDCIHTEAYVLSLKPENTTFSGLEDKTCCIFPTMKKVTTPFTDGMRRFGWSRGGGKRIHAASDLYRYKDEPLRSIAPGVVIRTLYYFYEDTYAMEVLHSGGFVVRYGETTGKAAEGIALGKQLVMGERIAFMGKVSSGCCDPMLHLELYSGKLKGPLTENGADENGIMYNRRRDLMNPMKYLLKWQNEQF
jgi:murein DD-endopeptidase MepM/ murein hydrolase activator NlpD